MQIEECDLLSEDVCSAIVSELAYQRQKWGDRQHSAAEWLLIIEKLVNDARRAWVVNDSEEPCLHELRQIAATAFAAMGQCGARARVAKAPQLPETIAEKLSADFRPVQ